MKYCPMCGGDLEEKILPTEDRPRLICQICQFVLYKNPKLVAAAIPIKDGKVILLRRGIEPRKGTWTFPGGYVELGETVEEAALRETKEETNLDVRILSLLNIYSRPDVSVVVVVYLSEVTSDQSRIGHEALEIAAFSASNIPWDELSFPSTRWALTDWVKTRNRA